MTTFVQLHMLVSYPPSNLNRDDLGRPKTAVMGGAQRIRVSSQSLKRAWRMSPVFDAGLAGHRGVRTKEMGTNIHRSFTTGLPLSAILNGDEGAAPAFAPLDEKRAREWGRAIAAVFGKLKEAKKGADGAKQPDSLEIEQLAHFSPEEIAAIEALVARSATEKTAPTDEDLKSLFRRHTAADIAMFGRMLAANPKFNTEAAVQVAHAITVHEAAVEDDFFTAVDDLNRGDEDVGAGHMGETEFAAGLFYLYVCIDRDLLVENLQGDEALAKASLASLLEAAATISPTGKQNSFGSRAYASYILAEKGSRQPRSLSVAFLSPVRDRDDLLGASIARLEETRAMMEKVYGPCCDETSALNAQTGEGTLSDMMTFVVE
ncbi:MAG: type I-E CRISPR-associated protein Cas7/Cse4/CasC [Methanospirillum sp.]|nr:type I-E CRISPR-associated protein Cas7/Cse4/CasC [Methanospirillum sp.]